MSMDGRYDAKSQGGDAAMSMDGRYDARSPGWQCGACPGMDTMTQIARKAMWLCLCCFISLPALGSTACPAADYDETTRIKYIHDGDTLHLKDGRKVRLIGINTPEVARGNHAAEPFAAEATDALKALFKTSKSISLVYGEEKHDRYERLLAHGFTDNGKNIQAALLNQGHARAITFPPNTRFSACYLQQEREARCSKAGLWKKIKPLAAKKLDDTQIGFQLVIGKLKSININKKGIWLNLDDKLTVGIRPDNQSLFDVNSIYKMLNQKVMVRGWLNKSKTTTATTRSYYIRARHPSSIQLAAEFACN